jgi:hypothetical protein
MRIDELDETCWMTLSMSQRQLTRGWTKISPTSTDEVTRNLLDDAPDLLDDDQRTQLDEFVAMFTHE